MSERVSATTSGAGPRLDYRQLVESVGDGIYVLDLEGRFTYVNGAFLEMLGYEHGETSKVIGRHFVDVLTPESARVALEHFRQGMTGDQMGMTPFFEVEGVRRDGSTVHAEIRAGDLIDDGRRVGRYGVGRDISELKRLHATVAEKSERIALLEQRTRIAQELYERIGRLTLDEPSGGSPGDAALLELRRSLKVAAAADAGLSPTDLRIVELVGAGRSNKEISSHVHLSPDTIKDRVGKTMQLLGCRSRAELAAEAARRGLI
jgi:PAS domain S-box-containing protein